MHSAENDTEYAEVRKEAETMIIADRTENSISGLITRERHACDHAPYYRVCIRRHRENAYYAEFRSAEQAMQNFCTMFELIRRQSA